MFRPLPSRPPLALLAAALLFVPALSVPAHGQELPPTGGDAADPFVADAATLIPADAGVVVRIKDPDSALTHLTAFVRNAAPQYAPQMIAGRGLLGMSVKNATLSGVNLKEPWYIVGIPRENAEPATVYLLPAANVQAMETGLGPGIKLKVIGTYVAYTDAGEEVLEAFGEGGGFVKSLPEGAAEIAADHDVALAINVPRLLEVYGDQLEEGLAGAKDRAAESAPNAETAASQAQAIDALVGLLKDSGSTVVGFKATEEALSVKKLSAFKPNSRIAAVLAKQSPKSFDTLARLPEGMDGYIAMEGDFQPLLRLVQSMLTTEEQAPQREIVAALAKAGMTATAGGFQLGGESLLTGAQVTTVKDVAAAKPAIEKYLQAADGMEQQGLRTTIEEAGTMEVGGITLQKYVTDLEAVEDTEQTQAAVKAFRTMFGEAGQEQMIGFTDDAVLQINGGGDAFVEEVVSHATGASDHTNEALTTVGAMLPKQGNVFGAIDLASVAQAGLAMAIEKEMFPPLFPAEQVRGVQIENSYAAFVLRVEGETIVVEGVIPAEQVRNVVEFGTALQGGAQGF
ncbi:hypothetical protein [Alienimonas californiensis]|uniref:Uncharacterized protein n=1 Tax=Alienimonas californiensis TaxID=2527989 RepID=A0A517PBS4_9PLAN|nr:hypothetical protein [Alienimonas californiensis]QDT16806.1 hypothetical protein CA12_29130 [Alienimonas californiensis]